MDYCFTYDTDGLLDRCRWCGERSGWKTISGKCFPCCSVCPEMSDFGYATKAESVVPWNLNMRGYYFDVRSEKDRRKDNGKRLGS